MHSLTRLALWFLVLASGIWAAGSLAFGDALEAAKCASLGVGVALVLIARERRPLVVAGFAIAALGTFPWLAQAIARGSVPLRWGAIAVGLAVVAIAMAARAPAWVARAGGSRSSRSGASSCSRPTSRSTCGRRAT